jgi:hypothetical protein
MVELLFEKIPGTPETVVRYLLVIGKSDCVHWWESTFGYEQYEGHCLCCKHCGRVETDPQPGEMCEFHGMTLGRYLLQADGRPGPGSTE